MQKFSVKLWNGDPTAFLKKWLVRGDRLPQYSSLGTPAHSLSAVVCMLVGRRSIPGCHTKALGPSLQVRSIMRGAAFVKFVNACGWGSLHCLQSHGQRLIPRVSSARVYFSSSSKKIKKFHWQLFYRPAPWLRIIGLAWNLLPYFI